MIETSRQIVARMLKSLEAKSHRVAFPGDWISGLSAYRSSVGEILRARIDTAIAQIRATDAPRPQVDIRAYGEWLARHG